jgi:putative oxidoreductase
MRHLPTVAGILLGLIFVFAGLAVLLKLFPEPQLPEGTPMAMFMAAMAPTGYLTFIKVLEVVGGVLVAIPRLRNFGLLVLGPIIVNILAYHIFIMNGTMLLDPMLIIAVLAALYLLWDARAKFAALIN